MSPAFIRTVVRSVLFCFPLPAAAQPQNFGSIFVTAARSAQPLAQIVADVTVIDAEEIARSGAQSLADLLQRQAGIEIVRNGGPATTSGIFIRGANRNQTLLLIDGLRVMSSTVGAPSIEAVPVEAIERIEILRGPASSLYGADAIGGVIQIFTRDTADRFTGHASAGHGTHDTRVLSAGLSGRIGALRLSVQAGGRRSEGFNATTPDASFIFDPDRDGYESEDVSARATLAIASGHEASVQLLRNRLDAQFDGGEGFDDRTLTTIELWRFESRNAFTSWWTSKASVGESRDESVSKSAFGDSPFRTRQREYAWQNEFVVPHGTVIVAAERREETIDEEAGFAVRRRNTDSLTAVGQFQRDAHAVQANIRHDQSDRQGGETTGAIAWGWQFRPGWRLTAGYSTAFKAPSFNDLYFPGFSNPDLEPERARSVEAGLHWQRNVGDVRLNARAIGWRNEVDELIVFQCDASFNCLPRNVASATLAGVTFGIDADWRNTTVKASLDVQSPRDDETGRLLPRRARRHGAWTLLHRIGPVRLGVEGIASSHRFDDAENTRRLAGYALLNVTAEWQLPHNVTLLARADNVTDRRHALASGFATPGTQLFAGVRWQP